MISLVPDVKLTSDEIIVLSLRKPCVSLYTYSHQLIREIIPRGEGNPVLLPTFLILDSSSNILITARASHGSEKSPAKQLKWSGQKLDPPI